MEPKWRSRSQVAARSVPFWICATWDVQHGIAVLAQLQSSEKPETSLCDFLWRALSTRPAWNKPFWQLPGALKSGLGGGPAHVPQEAGCLGLPWTTHLVGTNSLLSGKTHGSRTNAFQASPVANCASENAVVTMWASLKSKHLKLPLLPACNC